jgi:DNA gyrase subunit A
MPVDGIRRAGRSTQGVIVMRLREGEQVSTLARVAESDENGEPNEIDAAADTPPVDPAANGQPGE